MKAQKILTLAGVAALGLAGPAAAVIVPLDHAVRIQIPGAAASVVVANSRIADVNVIDTHTVYVSGKEPGQTDVVVLDSFGRPLYSSSIEVTQSGPGRIAVYRGVHRIDFACSPDCAAEGAHTTAKTDEGSGAGGALAGALGPK